ncbi:MAG: hypothetical protein JO306_02935, partial [Gemmatimonadetes bacterium]|nr:hypothetical protein [Gemmatimonadota bacterium]
TMERLYELVPGSGAGVSAFAQASVPARLALAATAGNTAAGYAVLMLLWPARVLLRWGRPAPGKPADGVRLASAPPLALVAGVVALGVAIAATALFPASTGTSSLDGLAPPAALALTAALLALSALAAELRLGRWAVLVVPAALLLFLLVIVQAAVGGPGVVSLVLMAAFSLSFTLALARLECVAATGKGLRELPPLPRRAVAAALLMMTALLVWWAVEFYGSGSVPVISTWLLTVEGFQFARVVLATLLLRILHQESRAPAGAFGARALAAGPLLGAVVFFPASAQWYYVPVNFLVGWLVLRQLIAGAGKPDMAGEGEASERALLDELVDVKVFRRTVDAYRTKQLAKVSSGDLEFPEYEANREHLEQVLAGKEAALQAQAGGRPEAILSRGARVDPWRNAVVNTVWATAFGMPWIVLSLREAAGWHVHSTFLLLEQALLLAAQWPLYGTFFGYFYARLPGWSGFAKAFWFALAAVVPGVVLNVVSLAPTDAWRDLGLFALPVLIQVLLLGLSNDFAMLRRHGFTWRTLADLHNLGAVTAWFSTLILAIATAAATLLTSQASDLFKRALDAAGSAPPAAQTTRP